MEIFNWKKITQQTYDAAAEKVAARCAEFLPNYQDVELAEFLKLVTDQQSGNRILDVGCGSGEATQVISQKRFEVVGIDLSAKILTFAKEKVPVIQMDMENLGFADNSFDGFWAMTSLLHLPKANTPGVISELARVLKPGGIGYVGLKGGQGETFCNKHLGADRYFSFWELDEFLRITKQHFTPHSYEVRFLRDTEFLNFFLIKRD